MPKTTVNFTNNKRNITKEKKHRKKCKEIHREAKEEEMNRIIDNELTFQETRDHWQAGA